MALTNVSTYTISCGISREEYSFYVCAQVHAQCRRDGMKKAGNLSAIAREMGLNAEQERSLRGKAARWAELRGKPKGVEDKGWVQPTPIENRMAAA